MQALEASATNKKRPRIYLYILPVRVFFSNFLFLCFGCAGGFHPICAPSCCCCPCCTFNSYDAVWVPFQPILPFSAARDFDGTEKKKQKKQKKEKQVRGKMMYYAVRSYWQQSANLNRPITDHKTRRTITRGRKEKKMPSSRSPHKNTQKYGWALFSLPSL